VSPLLVLGPFFWFLAPLLLNPGDGPACRDPMIIFSDSRDPNRVPKTP